VRIWYPKPLDDEVIEELQRLAPSHSISREPGRDTEMLIDGRATVEQMDQCPNLRYVVIPFAGVSPAIIDVVRRYPKLSLHNLHHNAPETAELAIALLFAAAKQVVPIDQALRKNDWRPRYSPESAELLEGKTCVLLGYGEIGRRIGAVVSALGMKTIPVRRNPAAEGEVGPGDLRAVLPKADVLMITVPLTPETEGLIGARELAAMPAKSILVNVARAQIVDELSLFTALESGPLHSAGLDVWYRYPKDEGTAVPSYFVAPPSAADTAPSQYPFHELPNLVMSPHRGGATAGTERRRVQHLATLIAAAGRGAAVPNRVDLDLRY
jgi:phosphoglycerate dehydrogenase-like enzyme